MIFAKEKKTAKDYFLLPEGTLCQLIYGELIMSPAPSPKHQDIVKKLFLIFNNTIDKNKLGITYFSPVDVYFDEENILQPDIVIIFKENYNKIKEKFIQGAPDIVVEVLSTTNAYYDLKFKKNIYERFNVKEYWIVDPMESSVEIFTNQNQKFQLYQKSELPHSNLIQSSLLSDLKINLEMIFLD